MTDRPNPVAIRLSPEERRLLQTAADRAGLSLSAWIRLVCVAAAGDTAFVEQVTRGIQINGGP